MFGISDDFDAMVELIDDVEHPFRQHLLRISREEQSADLKMKFFAASFGNERISGFLHAVVEEGVGILQAVDQPRVHGLPERRMERLLGLPVNHVQSGDLCDVPQTGELF